VGYKGDYKKYDSPAKKIHGEAQVSGQKGRGSGGRNFCARPLKEKEIFAGFACPAVSGVSRWAGSAPVRAQIVAQRKFERRLVIATRCNFPDCWRKEMARSAPQPGKNN